MSDERIGAERSRNDIAAFFRSARMMPFVQNGVFVPTGETLLGIQDRLLPRSVVMSDSARIPLFRTSPRFAVLSLRAGIRVGENSDMIFGAVNLTDRNYRHHGSGIDAPGLNLTLSWEIRF